MMRVVPMAFGAVPMIALCVAAASVQAFELTPKPTKSEAAVAMRDYGISFRLSYPVVSFGLHTFSTPVHEALTQLAYDCTNSIDDCLDIDLDYAQSGVLAGVRWNDDPPFQFANGQGKYSGCPSVGGSATVSFALRTTCWLNHFRDVAAIADAKPGTYVHGGGTLLARTHFGDLQFLHSMASTPGTSAVETKRRIMMWAEFTWRVQSGGNDFISQSTPMGHVPVEGLAEFFPANEARTVADLFTLGRPWLRHQLGDVAFGSLLHMVEDSYAGGHAARRTSTAGSCADSEILSFHTYAGQDKAAHKARDGLDAARKKLQLTSSLKSLVKMRDDRLSWSAVRPFLSDCVFPLTTNALPSSTEVSD